MNRALPLLLLAGCGSSAAAPPQPPVVGVIVRIADLTDCGGSGTTCPELTGVRRIRVGLDGSVAPLAGGVAFARGHVEFRSPGKPPMEIPLRGFGSSPRLSWSPSGRRFSVLEDADAELVDRALIVDPAQRRWWPLPLSPQVRELPALSWTDDDRLVAETFGRDDYVRLVTLDAVSGERLRARFLDTPLREITWSPSAGRLAVQDYENRIGVVPLTHPTDINWTDLRGTPTWSPDGTRILGSDPGHEAVTTWPGLQSTRLVRDLTSATWLPDGHTLVALDGNTSEFADGPADLVLLGEAGQIARVIPVHWPARLHPDDPFSLGPIAIPIQIEGLDRWR